MPTVASFPSSHTITTSIGDVLITKRLPRKTDVVGQMYKIEWPECNENSLSDKLHKMAGSLTLFAPHSREMDLLKSKEDVKGPSLSEDSLERPVTPINDEIREPPTSFKRLFRYIKRRIEPRIDVPYLTCQDQQVLADILIGEVQFVWQDIRRQIDDPFLSTTENVELSRRISVYIVSACQELFDHYLSKAKLLHDRRVFTDLANRSRLKSQISVHAYQLLNILVIRRHIVDELKTQRNGTGFITHEYQPTILKQPKKHVVDDSLEKLSGIQLELHEAFPTLDMEKIIPIITSLPNPNRLQSDSGSVIDLRDIEMGHETRISSQGSAHAYPVHRCESVPHIGGETLFEELGMSISDMKRTGSMYNIDLSKYGAHKQADVPHEEMVRNDLEKLLTKERLPYDDMPEHDDLPPLLQAIARCRRTDGNDHKYRTILAAMLEKERIAREQKQKEDELKSKVTLEHPQPTVVEKTMPNQVFTNTDYYIMMVVKAADVRVSNRECLSPMVLHSFKPIYNDLLGEISSDMAKSLDQNLYMRAEIREVYEEIMKSISRAHFDVTNDKMVETSPIKLEVTEVKKKKAEKLALDRGYLVNKQLVRFDEPPWGPLGIDDWCKTPDVAEENTQNTFPCFAADPKAMKEKREALLDNTSVGFDAVPVIMVEKIKRSYDLWIDWWKSQIDFTDYKKYLTLKNTDYLGVIYHLYVDQSQTEFERKMAAERAAIEAARKKLSLEEKARLEKMRQLKNNFETGMWNTLTVTMGGLGADPPLTTSSVQEDEEVSEGTMPPSDATSATPSTPAIRQTLDVKSRAGKQAMDTLQPEDETSSEKMVKLQPRLEKIWSAVRMPEAQRLDMAIKYSGADKFIKLQQVMLEWECVIHWILQREEILTKLEKFERVASDPDRFFCKGRHGSSATRFAEADEREQLYTDIKNLEKRIKVSVEVLKTKFGDIVTFNGRPYEDKIKWDRLEMLYWLQEERKQNAIKYELVTKDLGMKPSQLQPLFM